MNEVDVSLWYFCVIWRLIYLVFNFIRVGNVNQIAEDVKEYSLDRLTEKNAGRRPLPPTTAEAIQRAQNRITFLRQARSRLKEAENEEENTVKLDEEIAEKQTFIDNTLKMNRLQNVSLGR